MNKKNFLFAFVLILVFVSVAWAEGFKIGMLAPANMNESRFNSNVRATWKWSTLREDHSPDDRFVFYDNLSALQMALSAGKIKEIDVPEALGEYMITVNPDYEISCAMRCYYDIELAFGFFRSEKGFELQEKFNDAIAFLRISGKLDEIIKTYTKDPKAMLSKPVEFENFEGAETIKIAITGDMPPMDFIAVDGKPAGFNTAILSEIAKILKVNLEFINIETAARTATLTSGRADVVFRYERDNFPQLPQYDLPEGVLISEPYYKWNTYVHIRLKK